MVKKVGSIRMIGLVAAKKGRVPNAVLERQLTIMLFDCRDAKHGYVVI